MIFIRLHLKNSIKVPDTPSIALIVSCKSILFDRKRAGVSASSNIGNISNSICTLLLSNVASAPSVVKGEASEVEAAEVEAAEVEAAEIEAVEVEAVEVEAAEVEAELGDSLTALCAKAKTSGCLNMLYLHLHWSCNLSVIKKGMIKTKLLNVVKSNVLS